jgi:hypothetical protein
VNKVAGTGRKEKTAEDEDGKADVDIPEGDMSVMVTKLPIKYRMLVQEKEEYNHVL